MIDGKAHAAIERKDGQKTSGDAILDQHKKYAFAFILIITLLVFAFPHVSRKCRKTSILAPQRTKIGKSGSIFATEHAVLRGFRSKTHYFFESPFRVWHDNCIGMAERVKACFKGEAER
ncbi:hypothetical protein [Neorhizobium alkalisoli]|uniref:hypothetical protein n=1 Tax=Neorhizobium alkalisoli TaxID=528178 RepID=UPI001319EDDE|nr:hypothetical protein [Neorhizobium alkalisoli]